MAQWNIDQLFKAADDQNISNPYELLNPGDTVIDDNNEVYTWNGSSFSEGSPFQDGELTNVATQAGATMMGAALGAGGNPFNRKTGDTQHAASLRDQAELAREQAGRAQTDAQRGYQLASRDARVEGDKDAATRAAAQYGQKMAQISGAAGGGAAALASMNVQDPSQNYQEHRQRADTQHVMATQLQDQAEGAKRDVVSLENDAEQSNREARDRLKHNRMQSYLSNQGPQTTPGQNNQSSTTTQTTTNAAQTVPQPQRINDAMSGIPTTDQRYTGWKQRLEQAQRTGPKGDPTGIKQWDQVATEINSAMGSQPNWIDIATSKSRPGEDPRFMQGQIEGAKEYDEKIETGDVPSDTRSKNIIRAINRRF